VKLTALKLIYDVVTRWDSAYKMLSRALYLRKAIDYFVADDEEFQQFQLTKKEWDQAAIVCTILLPFKLASQRLQGTKRPGINSVFWDYESLFNKIDAIKETFTQPAYVNKDWIQELHVGVDKLSKKLSDYYSKTEMPFVYPDSCILEPLGKMILFKQPRFGGGEPGQYVEKYKRECRERYIKNYESINAGDSNPRKRPHEESDDESDEGDYRSFLHTAAQGAAEQNEFDRYLLSPPPDKRTKTLDYWKDHTVLFPHLSLMARDRYAVPATGAGVERTFSKSGRVATWTRARLQSKTINETMLYKDYLSRIGQPLNGEEERRRAERKRERRKNPTPAEEDNSDSEGDEEEPELIKWELEWWRKENAGIII
jgi:hypothetical protein